MIGHPLLADKPVEVLAKWIAYRGTYTGEHIDVEVVWTQRLVENGREHYRQLARHDIELLIAALSEEQR